MGCEYCEGCNLKMLMGNDINVTNKTSCSAQSFHPFDRMWISRQKASPIETETFIIQQLRFENSYYTGSVPDNIYIVEVINNCLNLQE